MNVISAPGARFPRAVREHNLGLWVRMSLAPSSSINYVFLFYPKKRDFHHMLAFGNATMNRIYHFL